jgi:hypothetical protein
MMAEGKDNYPTLKPMYEKIKQTLSSIDELCVWGGGTHVVCLHVKIVTAIQGDLSYISQTLGLGSRFGSSGYNCVFCEVHTERIGSSSEDTDSSTARTLARLYHLAHLPCGVDSQHFPFTCPACHITFNSADVSLHKSVFASLTSEIGC